MQRASRRRIDARRLKRVANDASGVRNNAQPNPR